ncbi:DUF1285 domain-containing protein [Leucothrix arctica]|uniref:DUF1285 domain-containing protein n=1 Tax=Leucothrix arctica TaxID=1481894 RepID=A0A317CFS6_9GAMM|nr:DUF1285 domain-containing protein [Leucothrix arctica]PWQ97366.1 DUF1285 domain-containing protein [Leucothrix arctica]
MTENILESLAKNVANMEDSNHPPVHLWSPEHCGEINIVIQHDGSWMHDGGLIKREALVRLFSSVLWLEDSQHYLKTPAEKLSITVETTPFLITQMAVKDAGTEQQKILFTSSYGDTVLLGSEHPLHLDKNIIQDQEVPLVMVRYGMMGRLARSVFESVVELGEFVESDKGDYLKVLSDGVVFELS